jgi:uncharacterized protein GlcG (DUF336 family)
MAGTTDTFERRSLTTALADRVVAAATDRADELGLAVSVAVVDDGAALKAFRRMDGANLMCCQVAQDKAYTAVAYQWDTDLWEGFLADSVLLRVGASNVPRLSVYPGGQLIRVDGFVVGAVGVSGAMPAQDAELASTWQGVV